MGAKAPIVMKARDARHKCEFCNRIMPSVTSLGAHLTSAHPSRLKWEGRMVTRSRQQKKKLTNIVCKKMLKKPMSSEKPNLSPPKKVNILEDKLLKSPEKVEGSFLGEKECTIPLGIMEKVGTRNSKTIDPKKNNVHRVKFSCPKCERPAFISFFSALRHIKRWHCINEDGNPVTPDDPGIIQPIRIESCTSCPEIIKNTEAHLCLNSLTFEANEMATKDLVCLGCDLKYSNNKFYDLHLSGKHHDGFDGMFFNTIEEATEWKEQLEKSTETRYILISNTDNKMTYRCSHTISSGDNSSIGICPSTIVIQEFAKGTQVHFYKQHGGHTPKSYLLAEKFQRYLLTSVVEKAAGKPNRSDLYAQFKNLLEKVISEAVKVNLADLKKLSDKALDLAAILNLDGSDLRNVNGKVKYSASSSESESPPKRSRRKSALIERNATPPVEKTSANSFSLADDRHTEKLLKELESDLKRTPILKRSNPSDISSPSFNDSYKEFVDTLKIPKLKSDKSKPNLLKKKVVKTKMGQFKPSPEKKTVSFEPPQSSPPKAKEMKKEVEERENVPTVKDINEENAPKAKKMKKEVKERQNVPKAKEIKYEVKETENVPKAKEIKYEVKERENVPKAKQMKKEVKDTENVPKPKDIKYQVKRRENMPKAKEIKYEVKERENDCNILILKI